MYKLATEGETQRLFRRFEHYKIDVEADPIVELLELENIRDMAGVRLSMTASFSYAS